MQRFGRYEVLDEIARGGMGVVYRARDAASGRIVALKLMLRLEREVSRRRFQREGEALARVDHPHVVALLDHGVVEPGVPYLALELVEGESLQRRLDRGGPLALEDALDAAQTLCRAVAACHAAGLLHRDIKPDNVLVTAQGTLKLTDFGLARDTDPSQSRSALSREGMPAGSPGYWAPEQARGELERIDARTDVYGLGATLFALLTAQPPHRASNLFEALDEVERATPPPSTQNPLVPAWLDRVVGKALATQPDARFPGVEALAEALAAGAPERRAPAPAARIGALVLLLGGAGAAAIVAASAGPRAPGTTRPAADEPWPVEPTPADRATLKALHDRAEQAYDAGRFEEARDTFTELLRLDPGSADGYVNRSLARTELGDLAGARQDCDAALRLDPRFAEAYVRRGIVQARGGDLPAAIEDWTEAIRLRPDDYFAYHNRSLARGDLGDWQGQLEDSSAAIRLRPDSSAARYARGVARTRLEDWPGAVEDYTQAARLDPTDPSPLLGRGIARLELAEWQAAIGDLERALQLSPNAPWSEQVRQNIEVARGRMAREADLTARTPAEAAYARGQQAFDAGRYEDARGAFTEALRLRPDDPQALLYRASARGRLGDWQGAVEDCTEALQRDPRLSSAYGDRGFARGRLGDWEGAVEDCTEAIRLKPDNAKAYSNRGTARGALGDWQGALADCTEAVRLQPAEGPYHYVRSLVREQLGDQLGEVEDLERALALAPGAAWAPQARERLDSVRRSLAGQAGAD